MDSTSNSNDILMRLTNNALYWQFMIITVILMLVIDINDQKSLIPVVYSIDHDNRHRLLMGEGHIWNCIV